MPGFGLIALAIVLSATVAWALRKRRSAPSLLVLLVPSAVVARTVMAVPDTSVNGTVADADKVNENFSAPETRIATFEAALALVPRFIACPGWASVADTETGLLWERETTTGDVRDVGNT